MSKTIIPANYTPALNLYDTQRAIGTVKRLFADTLCATLNLYRVSAPLFLEASTGLNDDLNGVERKVTFDIKESGIEAQVVQSLAKWKRKALKDYDFRVGKGLYCDMNAIRRDEDLDNLHSIYVDQWDWEKVIRLDLSKIFTDKEEALNVIEKAILLYREQGQPGERFANTIERLGFENVEQQLMENELARREKRRFCGEKKNQFNTELYSTIEMQA